MEKVEKNTSRQPYKSDLSDAQWEIISPMIVLPEGGRPRTTNLRDVIDAILYQSRSGCAWYLLPHDFPPEGTVRRYFHYFKRIGLWDKINDVLRCEVRVLEGRDEEPSLVIIDSQSVKGTRTSGEVGYDAGKKIKGVKRHFMVDVLGLLICIVVHAANIQERAGAKLLLAKAATKELPRVEKVLSDDGYSGQPMVKYVHENYGWTFESVKRTELHQFQVMPQRWVVERTIGWMNNFRGLSKHYDYDPATGEAKIQLASVYYLSKRLTEKKPELIIDHEINERLLQLAKNVSQPS